eukprot:Blabericola_migrator_1__3823@NODE_2151_length_3198_cov_332_916959_g1360_i0_p2_GENE_NODE_2151_length_3198_cov_332_916959_g1360_i0NODE_2151_length_3198_cov_332_916959_g1360_i0_p2_ORF_typecomplete_len110_score12_22_NODE_2151_length_3198_cov_332_916959_g1360_i023642693
MLTRMMLFMLLKLRPLTAFSEASYVEPYPHHLHGERNRSGAPPLVPLFDSAIETPLKQPPLSKDPMLRYFQTLKASSRVSSASLHSKLLRPPDSFNKAPQTGTKETRIK